MFVYWRVTNNRNGISPKIRKIRMGIIYIYVDMGNLGTKKGDGTTRTTSSWYSIKKHVHLT